MTGPLFLGADGGGTKTRFALIDAERRLVAETTLGTSYHPEVGVDGVRAVLTRGVAAVLDAAGVGAQQITHAFFGLPAHGEDSRITPVLDELPAAILGHDRFAVDNDMVCGWAGSLGGEDGINIVAGTGSIGYGQRRGLAARAGGWGEGFSDEGSAYWIAMQGLNAFSRMSDGRLPRGPLHPLLREHLALGDDLDLCAHVYGPQAKSRGELAQLSPLVTRAAQLGDDAARAIFARAGAELAGIVEALRQRLRFPEGETVKVSYSGGAFAAGDPLMQPFIESLNAAHSSYALLRPLHEPHLGAALYAAALHGRATR